MSVPKVSVGLPVYNAERYLAIAIEAHLAQSFGDFELIISDNASTDRTAAICEDFSRRDRRVRYVRSPVNRGLTWNHAAVLAMSSGTYFRWGAGDDVPGADLLRECVEIMDGDRRVSVCVPATENIDAAGTVLKRLPDTLELRGMDPVERGKAILTRDYQMIFLQGLMRRVDVAARAASWTYYGWDFILLLELALRGEVAMTRSALLQRRVHEAQASRLQRDVAAGLRKVEPDFAALFVFPHWRWQLERVRAALAAPLSVGDKARLVAFLARHTWWQRRTLAGDLRSAMLGIIGRRQEMPL